MLSTESDAFDPEPTTATESDISPPRGNPFPVVGVGASAGGLEAFGQLLSAVPSDTGMAFVLVQHLDPAHNSLLSELLTPYTSMPVRNVEDGMRIEPNHVYVIPPNTSMVLEDDCLRLVARGSGLHLPVDIFFRSLAKVQGSRAVGIVLSGNASDGSLGLRAIKGECGITFAQDESTARFGGMPRNAVSTGAVDFVLSPASIGKELSQLGSHPYLITPQPGQSDVEILPGGDGDLKRVFALLLNATRVDFSHYKHTTVRRRIGRRMMVLRQRTLADYVRYAETNSAEMKELYRDLLISVTSFFRDRESFDAFATLLKNNIVDRTEKNSFRVWVSGCATGEEVYSLAICIYEILQDQDSPIPLQLFGTDISELALERARHGAYSEAIVQDVTPDRLNRFFSKTETGYQIAKKIRDCCIFARHDVTRDPPFSNMDLVSCRNLLIYLDGAFQRRVFPAFHYALKPDGILMLGSAESIGSAEELFDPLVKQAQIYRRKATAARFSFDSAFSSAVAAPLFPELRAAPHSGFDLQKKVDRVIQGKYSPDAVLVNAEMQILQFRGHTSLYLDPTHGEASLNLLRMAHENLVLPLRRVVQAAIDKDSSVLEQDITFERDGIAQQLQLEVTPVTGGSAAERYYLVVFTAASGVYRDSVDLFVDEDGAHGKQTDHLKRELAETREYLRNITEDYEAGSEELRAANEEARSANEELQSANEELGTTKEELQSTNEELTTVNEELLNRNGELSATNGDLKNLLGAVSLGILMVDSDLRVRRFNPAAEVLLELHPSDIGRPVAHLRGRIETPQLEERARAVIETLNAHHQELQDKEGCWYSISIRPYRTLDDRINGVVITFQDIDALKRGLAAAEEARDYAEGMIETVREPLVVLDADLRVQRATTSFYETFLVSREETEGRLLYDLGNGQWNRPRLRELLGAAMFRQEVFYDYQVEHEFPHIGTRVMRLNARRIPRQDLKNRMLLLAIEDVTERSENAEIRFRRLFETAKDGIVVLDIETETIVDVNPYMLELTGFPRDRFINRRLGDVPAFGAMPEADGLVSQIDASEVVKIDELNLNRSDGRIVTTELVGNRYQVGSQSVVQLNIRDITHRKKAAQDLHDSQQRFRLFVESVQDYGLFQLDTEGTIVTWTSGAERLLGWTEAEAIGKNAELVFTPEDVERGAHLAELSVARTRGRAEDERWHIRKNGSRFFASGVLTQVCDQGGRLQGFAKIMRDVTRSKLDADRLRQQAALLDLAHDAIIVRQLDGEILFWNKGAERLYGWPASVAIGKLCHQLLRANYPESIDSINARLFASGRWDGELEHFDKAGNSMAIASRWALQPGDNGDPGRVLEINGDITARKEQEEHLQRSVEEKSMLVREIHHRVKNNLQVIVSLLSLQANHIKDPEQIAAFEETESRVRAIAQIHERLYASEDLTEVEFAAYLTHLSRELVALYTTEPERVNLKLSLQEMVLHIEQAVPLGLIANELIINSLKHGFRKTRGALEISLRYIQPQSGMSGSTLDEGWGQIRIRDTGPGLPDGFELPGSNSLGFRIITLLVRQLRGELEIVKGPGADISVKFPLSLSVMAT